MFEFEKLTVYQKAKLFDQNVLLFVYANSSIDKVIGESNYQTFLKVRHQTHFTLQQLKKC